jgi:acetyl-CoA/propionyl-CoA carboxylase, biotin carboxylase, biotin carboxyl carrier protein
VSAGRAIKKLLVANRGEIAVRVIRTAREMGIATVAVYSDADRESLHVELADESCHLGPSTPSQSYLSAEKLLEAARQTGAQAVHPGYGFLAENAAFARRVTARGLVWVGPNADAIEAMGEKLRARRVMAEAGVPVVPGDMQPIADVAGAKEAARRHGFPVALKAASGGGGKGLRIAHKPEELEAAFQTARREAEAYFKDGTIYAERYLQNPKHVELQVLADKHGHVVHLGERDCSLQRRHQKLWEETPAVIPERVRAAMREAGVRAAKAIGYDSAGTIECLVAGDDFFFLEMNTRIQVEHTVTEAVTGLDLIREQIRIAAGQPLGYAQDAITFRGCAIEARINAEDPAAGFAPAPGRITAYREPGGLGVRVDSAAYAGWTIPAEYDSLVAKLIVWAPSRDEAIARLRRAVGEYEIEGIPTTLSLFAALCDLPEVRDSSFGTATLERFVRDFRPPERKRDPNRRASALPGERRTAPRLRGTHRQHSASDSGDVVSPMHGIIVEIGVTPGERVSEGQVVAVIEAMKMMNEIRAHRSGTVGDVFVGAGSSVERATPLLRIA